MESVNEELIGRIDGYIEDLFTPPDEALRRNLTDAAAAGLPSINVSPNQGRLLYLLARLAGASRILEVGTLGGYSAVARRNLERAGLAPKTDLRVGPAGDSLRDLIRSAAAPFDLVFLDADKSGCVEYLELALELSRPGTLIVRARLDGMAISIVREA